MGKTRRVGFSGRRSAVFHFGFMTYLLIVAVVIVAIALVDPPLFNAIMNAVDKMARAVRGS